MEKTISIFFQVATATIIMAAILKCTALETTATVLTYSGLIVASHLLFKKKLNKVLFSN